MSFEYENKVSFCQLEHLIQINKKNERNRTTSVLIKAQKTTYQRK